MGNVIKCISLAASVNHVKYICVVLVLCSWLSFLDQTTIVQQKGQSIEYLLDVLSMRS